MLNNSTLIFRDYSVPKDDPMHTKGTDKELYEAIKRQMAPSSPIIMLSGVISSYSRWVEKEIKIAKMEFANPKPIIAVRPWGAERTSRIVEDAADIVVNWQTTSIVEAIKRF